MYTEVHEFSEPAQNALFQKNSDSVRKCEEGLRRRVQKRYTWHQKRGE